jgi:preprotein translocase subunit SecE
MAYHSQQVKEPPVVDVPSAAGGEERPSRPIPVPRPAGSGLRMYKPGQGYYTRLCTAIGAGVMIAWGAFFLQEELSGWMTQGTPYYFPVQYGVAVGFILALGALTYWVVGLNRKANDFFIATEGEMKKVNWSTRQEVVRSTKVVIVSVVLMGVFLFVADVLFMEFFSAIKVLQTPSMLRRLFGG